MAELDRRIGDERRSSKRYAVNIEVEWETHSGRRAGTVSDLSSEGCFILTDVDLTEGELVKVFIPLTDGMKVEFLGQVANFVYEIGFAMHFLSLTDSQREFLTSFVDLHGEDAEVA